MYESTFCVAGVTVRLESPFRITTRAPLAPFMSENCISPDLRVVFEEIQSLPVLTSDARWYEDHHYVGTSVFVRNYPTEPPYAVLTWEDNVLRCRYLPGTESRMSDTGSVLNLIGLEKILLDNSGFLLHSSFIKYRDAGILFSAPCGTGKSTQADLWKKYRGADILNGDRAGIRRVDGAWMAFGMPFAGTSGIYRNESAPIAAIVTLAQGPENVIRRLRPSEAISRLLPECSCQRWDAAFMNSLLDLLLRLVQQVPVYLLECRPDEGAVELLRDTMRKDVLLWQ